jgi:hypothetical protein
MARSTPRPHPTTTQTLQSCLRHCPCCGNPMWVAYHHYRTVTTLSGVLRLTLKIRRCLTPACPQFQRPYRPEEEGRLALPKHACGLDVITLIGTWRHAQQRSVPEIQQEWGHRRVARAPRTVLNLLERYDALVPLSLTETTRLQRLPEAQGRVILAWDGLQPAVGHEGLWVLRDGLASEVLLARSVLSATHDDLAALLRAVKQTRRVPMAGVISDGQLSIRRAVEVALSEGPHPLGHFHDLREAAQPIYEADRHVKKARKQHVRGVRPIARQRAGRTAPEAEVIRGYGGAGRRALTEDGRPPWVASGLTRHDRLAAMAESLDRVETRGPCPRPALGCRPSASGA